MATGSMPEASANCIGEDQSDPGDGCQWQQQKSGEGWDGHPNGASGQWMGDASGSSQLLPLWQEQGESQDHCKIMLDIHTKFCPDFRRGYCNKGKGKGSHCFCYHFDSQARRPPVNSEDGKLRYWDVQCPHWNPEVGFCPNGQMCIFAHGRNEVSYHPAKYKTRLCNGTECRGEAVCCFAHSEEDMRSWANERYSHLSAMAFGAGGSSASASQGFIDGLGQQQQQKHRFCASFPNVAQCRRGVACAFAHAREEVTTPLLAEEEEASHPKAMTEVFFTEKFKTLWCPIGAQHDWQNCPYAHTYQDARRDPSIGYGPQPCPYWSKKDTRVAYAQRCPLGLRCPYSHGAKEQLYHPNYFRTVICRDLQPMKGCPRQKLCAFYHRRQERRSADADSVDYTQPLDKGNVTTQWSTYFLQPPFFQESDEGQGAAAQGMGMPGGKGMQMGFHVPVAQKGGVMTGSEGNWYAGYLAGMYSLAGMGGGMPMPTGARMGDGGLRNPTGAESDGGGEVDELESNQEMLNMQMADGGWIPQGAAGFHSNVVRVPLGGPAGPMVWGGMPFYGPPTFGGPGCYGGAMSPEEMPGDAWGWTPQ